MSVAPSSGTLLQAQRLHCTSTAELCMPIRDVFDQAHQQIYHLTDTDAFPRFTQFIHAQMHVRRMHILEQVSSTACVLVRFCHRGLSNAWQKNTIGSSLCFVA